MIDDTNEKEPQILLVGDPSQIAALQVCTRTWTWTYILIIDLL